MHELDSFGREYRRVADQVAHWTPARWRLPVDSDVPGGPTRGDAMHDLVQTLADIDAEVEAEPQRTLPRLPHDTALCDQLRVVGTDLVAAEPNPVAIAAARNAIAVARGQLFDELF